MKLVLVLLLALAAVPSEAATRKKSRRAPSRKVESEFREADRALKDSLKEVRRACALPKLTVEMDWPSFKGQVKDRETQRSAAGLCETVVDGLKQWCDERETKGGLGKQLASVRCSFRRDALRFQGERKGTAVWVYFGWETANLADEMNAWLKKAF